MQVSREPGGASVTINGHTVHLPLVEMSSDVIEGVAVVVLSPNEPTDVEPDVPETETPRNVIGLDVEGTHLWTIDHDPGQDPSSYYLRTYRFHDRCLCRRADDSWTEIDVQTGELLETLPASQFRVDGRVRSFPNQIKRFRTFDDIGMVIEDAGSGVHEAPITAFDSEGNQLWRREFESTWLLERDGKLLSMTEFSMGASVFYEHDPTTGKPIAIHSAFTDDPAVLKKYVPSSKHDLIDEYVDEPD